MSKELFLVAVASGRAAEAAESHGGSVTGVKLARRAMQQRLRFLCVGNLVFNSFE